jgi:hypothetical protein
MIVQKQQKNAPRPAKEAFKHEREQRGEQNPSPADEQLGATERQVQPLTPPSARSDQQPGDPKRGKQPDPGIDPADELTPG